MKKIDLHIHTNLSDGELSPFEVIDEARKNGVEVIAIADHDNVDAYTDEVYNYAEKNNIKLINAVEISTETDRAGIHVLGYNFDMNNKKLLDTLNTLRNSRHVYLHRVANKLRELGYVINEDELDKIKAVTKAHIADDIVNNDENSKLLNKVFNHIPSRGEFIETVMNEDCPAFVKRDSITPREAVEVIKGASGKAILAHPVCYIFEDNFTDDDIYDLVDNIKPDGIEANYIFHDICNNRIDQMEKWRKFAKEKNLITTLGSDFHRRKGHNKIGLTNEDIDLSDDDIDTIVNNILN